MAKVAETKWGLWGVPSQASIMKIHDPPQLVTDAGGDIKPEYAKQLAWYQKRATNIKDKEHCARLLSQLKQGDKQGRVKTAPIKAQHYKPTGIAVPKPPKPPSATRKQSAYLQQKSSVDRLSRPKTASQAGKTYRRPVDKTQEYKYQPRPKSAMADLGKRRVNDPYLSTHDSEYYGYPEGSYAEAHRPRTSNGFKSTYDLEGPIGNTTGSDEFHWKVGTKVEPIRAATASGNRRNNPHPHESFMRWRLAKKREEGMLAEPAKHLGYRKLDNDMMNQILKDQLKSTYQNDYLGIPQGYQVKGAIDAPQDWRKALPRPTVTSHRHTYAGVVHEEKELISNTTRYGCNKNKNVAAHGAVPTVTKSHVLNQTMIKSKTSYENEFCNTENKPDYSEMLNERTNQKIRDSFLRYAKIMEESKSRRRDEARTLG